MIIIEKLQTILRKSKIGKYIFVFILNALGLLCKNSIFTMKSGLAKGMKRRCGFGFKPKSSLNEEEKFLINLKFKGKTVFDVGGYIGIHTLFFAHAVGESGKVITFEPNPKNYEELIYNVRLNDLANVQVMQIGLGRRDEQMSLVMDPISPGRATVEKERKNKMLRAGGRMVKIEVVSLDNLTKIRKLPKPDFIKIDVEGIEMDVLYGMVDTINNYKPNLFIEIHGAIPRKMIDFLISKNYAISHIESNIKIDFSIFPVIKGGHLFCT